MGPTPQPATRFPTRDPTPASTPILPTKTPTPAPAGSTGGGSQPVGAGRNIELLLVSDYSQFSNACQAARTEDGQACSGTQELRKAAQARSLRIANAVRQIYARATWAPLYPLSQT